MCLHMVTFKLCFLFNYAVKHNFKLNFYTESQSENPVFNVSKVPDLSEEAQFLILCF